MKGIPRTVVMLGFISFFTDMSTEMIAPLLPIFLTSVLLAGPAVIGIIEGVAESTSSILKLISGYWADRWRRKKPLVFVGYGISSVARPFIGLATVWPFVLLIRFLDRVGKGIRTSPRDALIADAADPANRGRAYGFHRMMDHAGAVVGPLIAAALMRWAGFSMQQVFYATAIPAIAVILILGLGLKEPARSSAPRTAPPRFFTSTAMFGSRFWVFMAALLVFTLGNSTDAFILLLLSSKGVSTENIALLWALFHLVKMGATWTGGNLSDKLGRRFMVLCGWGVYALVYWGFSAAVDPKAVIALFLAYGIFFGFTEPSEKAWVADLVPADKRGTAFGYYNLVIGLGALPASVLFGWIWKVWGSSCAFLTGASLAAISAVILMFVKTEQRNREGAK